MSPQQQLLKLKSILATLPPGTPTYKTVAKQLEEILKLTPVETTKTEPKIFQALGIIKGIVDEDHEEKYSLKIGDNNYLFKFRDNCFKAWLRKRDKLIGKPLFFRVYPKMIFPPKQQPKLLFEAIAFSKKAFEKGEMNQFKLKGFYQRIPQVKSNIITIYRNRPTNKQEIKRLYDNPDLLFTNHIPVNWENEAVRAYRWTKGDQQPPKYFVECLSTFNPDQGHFKIDQLLSEPTVTPPRYFKPKKSA